MGMDGWEVALGALILLVYAHRRFIGSKTIRASTTAVRLYVAEMLYIIAALFLWLLLTLVVSGSPDLIRFLNTGGAEIPASLSTSSGALLAALILTTLLPNFPLFSEIDAWLLAFFRELGHIPSEVRRVSATIRHSKFSLSAAKRDRVVEFVNMTLQNFPAKTSSELCLNESNPLYGKMMRAVGVFCELRELESDEKYTNFMHTEFAEEYKHISHQVEELIQAYAGLVPLLRSSVKGVGAANVDPIINAVFRRFILACNELDGEQSQFISYAILRCESRASARVERLRDFGFEVRSAIHRPEPFEHLLALAALVFVLFFAGMIVARELFHMTTDHMSTLLLRTLQIAVIYAVAAGAAVLLERKTRAHSSGSGHHLFSSALVAGMLAVLGAAAVMAAFSILNELSLVRGLRSMSYRLPWLIHSFATASALYLLLERLPSREGRDDHRRLWLAPVVMATLLAIVSYPVYELLKENPPPGAHLPPLAFIIGLSALIGAAVGYWIPARYSVRGKAGGEPAEIAPVEAAAPAGIGRPAIP